MGGQAFTKGPDGLYTPRMPRDIYEHVRDHCHALLRELFVMVATPIEGPGKSDFGDIDIFVAVKKEDYFGASAASNLPGAAEKLPFGTIAALFGAERKFQERDNVAMFAIPWPNHLPEGVKDTVDTTSDKLRFIQVDIHICPTIQNLEWFLFKHAHGDLWNLLGSTIRPFGLTVDEVGLYLRIPEVEKLDKKKAKVLLTTDPSETLRFLGLRLDKGQWEQAFSSKELVFEYAATCRFFWVKPKLADADHDDNDDDEGEGALDISGDYRKDKLKSNDRKRMNQRPLFRQWIEEFLPKCRAEGRFMTRPTTRQEVTEEASDEFGVRETYVTQLGDFLKERQRLTLWKEVIKPAIPNDLEPNFRSCAASAMKKIVMEDNEAFGVQPTTALKDDNGLYLEDKVRQFVEANWQEVGRVAVEQNHIRYLESLAAKAKKRTSTGDEKENMGPTQ
ncbi:hypothetical protein PFICI_00667 [Pestalotiopsis fici W106-1]|uniref:Uncharacterized protein n=1 Tax=Pestalotiopsis fici (strain W106-1 / CGMCC3.15140) TaxID=1229662 RepID=W3XLG1_PESFW|nr:uncharacterized protein PFICI_00667 [Pestalotiopsis fici W106-1]ETS86839.1 hypothetical protein PFICI_00667 [Pestalotiopsis fici W106-1]